MRWQDLPFPTSTTSPSRAWVELDGDDAVCRARALLSVPHDAAPAAIRSAFRTAALRWHPDRTDAAHAAEAAHTMQRLTEAYHLLLQHQSTPAEAHA